MSHNPYFRNAAAQAQEKVASMQATMARREFMARWNKMRADVEAQLAAAGTTLDGEPAPDMTGIAVVDYDCRLQVPINRPMNIPALEMIDKIYASEADLLNTTARAVQEYDLRFCQDGETP
jgi:hypothetical protein